MVLQLKKILFHLREDKWHKSLQFVKKSNMTLLPCLFMILLAVSMIKLCSTTF